MEIPPTDEISSTLSFFARYIHAFNQRACQLSVKVGVLGNGTRKREISPGGEKREMKRKDNILARVSLCVGCG